MTSRVSRRPRSNCALNSQVKETTPLAYARRGAKQKNKVVAILKDVAAFRADRSKTQEELSKLRRDLEESNN